MKYFTNFFSSFTGLHHLLKGFAFQVLMAQLCQNFVCLLFHEFLGLFAEKGCLLLLLLEARH